MSDLTERQQQILAWLRACEAEGRFASVREIMIAFEITSPNGAVCHLKALEAKGRITIEHGRARGIRCVKDEQDRELERMAKCWRGLPYYLRKELLHIAEHYHEAATVHEEVKS